MSSTDSGGVLYIGKERSWVRAAARPTAVIIDVVSVFGPPQYTHCAHSSRTANGSTLSGDSVLISGSQTVEAVRIVSSKKKR